MTTVNDILAQLKSLGRAENLEGMARYGINTEHAYGVPMGAVKELVRTYKGDHTLALDLWVTGIREARLMGALIADPHQVTPELMDAWVADFDSWDICDTTTNQCFRHTPFATRKALEWSRSRRLFTRRAGFALMAGLALKTSLLSDDAFEPFFERIVATATDDRNLIKKAVNWALRQIGKRNTVLHKRSVSVAEELLATGDKTAVWIAGGALKELLSDSVRTRLTNRNPSHV